MLHLKNNELCVSPNLTGWDQDRMNAILQQTLSNEIFLCKICSFEENLTEILSEGSHERIVIISLDNSL